LGLDCFPKLSMRAEERSVHRRILLQCRNHWFDIQGTVGTILVAVYSGDVTYNVPAIGTQMWVDAFDQELVVPWDAWYLEGQVAGYYKKFEKITYVTVLGSGHMVPMYSPAAAKELLNSYFNSTF